MDLASKVGRPALYRLEEKFKACAVTLCPYWLETHHLTLLTILWSLCVVACGLFAMHNRALLGIVTVFICLQYTTDVMDGEVGRRRNTGLVKWGWYADHVLDAVFVLSVTTACAASVMQSVGVVSMALLWGPTLCVVHAYVFSATVDQVRIYFARLGPTEGRIFLVVQVLVLSFCGVDSILLTVLLFSLVPLVAVAGLFLYANLKLWDKDLRGKRWPKTVFRRITSAGVSMIRSVEASRGNED